LEVAFERCASELAMNAAVVVEFGPGEGGLVEQREREGSVAKFLNDRGRIGDYESVYVAKE